MTDEAFLRAIAESPRDDAHRLVYADWLEERGDPRAEWLHLQRTLASPVPDKARYTDLCAREQELHRALDPVWLHAVRRYTTPPPCRDIAKLVPALAPFARTTTRLHPRRAPAPLPAWQSKIGGLFLWPQDEEWPECPVCRVPLVPVIQLRASDVPLVAFPPGMDLFQLFWCPDRQEHDYQPVPIVFWRTAEGIGRARDDRPTLRASARAGDLAPSECSIFPEPVIEYPIGDELDLLAPGQSTQICEMIETLDFGSAADLADRLGGAEDDIDAYSLAFTELGMCPGSVAGGISYPDRAGPHDHLLTLATWECDSTTFRRWLPLEDQRLMAQPGLPLSHDASAWEAFREIIEAHKMRLGRTQRAHLGIRRDRMPWEVALNIGS